ncbi:glycerol dehydrogenase [Periweissella cryptocerci]|uniref:Glycerol dehydrogenase n=1 Tax=Periweissella cryptocerci TaxID=2506420 RepID=A0A4P6YRH7_9LACO|nr:glycerol dehydrogenase [Periweissella cryptocerci]QBO35203.1 glycerol dehydrogenase [Periweissella cryptocerci]
MTQIFASPSTYIQGKDVLNEGSQYIEKFGKNVLMLAGGSAKKYAGNTLIANLEANGFKVNVADFQGEASDNEINRIAQIGKAAGAEVVIGVGGGKAIDSAKSIADILGTPVVIVPTIASTDAPTSRLSVLYTDEGNFDRYEFYQKNPELVLVDTRVIANAPVRMLASGIADALATFVEVRDVQTAYGDTMLGAKQTLASIAIGQMAEDTLFAYGHAAIESNKVHAVTPALEKIVEANTLLSGLGFESGGLAAAHSIHNGFTALKGDIHHLTHGEKVAYGILTELFLDGADEATFEKYLEFIYSLGLPTTLADLHLADASDEDLLLVGQQATAAGETIKQMPYEVTADDVVSALKGVDGYVRNWKAVRGLN